MTSTTVEGSALESSDGTAVDFQIEDSTGAIHDVEVDLQGEYWLAVMEEGDVLSGSVPEAALDDHYIEGFPVPCVTNPISAAVCIGGAGLLALACEIRTSLNMRRQVNNCARQGMGFTTTGITGCGNVEGYCFQPQWELLEK